MSDFTPSPFATPPPDDLASLFPDDPNRARPGRTLLMGILNVTPDSFSDGGLFTSPENALNRARQMVADGADLIDIGGASTRPGSEMVSEEEELRRIAPVFEALSAEISVPLSIDTTWSSVAREAVRWGAKIVNDISGLRFDPQLAKVAADHDAFLVLMHSRGTPQTMQSETHYEDLMGEITIFLRSQAKFAMVEGVSQKRIIFDPGIGFAKNYEQNLTLLRRQSELLKLGYPLLLGVSRKAFIGRLQGGVSPQDRVEGTAAAVTLAIAQGARIVRVHDVREMARVARVADAICRGTE